MILLTTTEKLNILVESEDLMKGQKNFKILCQQRIYDGNTYECISDPERFKLYKNIILEYEKHKPEAEAEFDRQYAKFKKSEPAPAQSGTDFGTALQNMMLKVLAEQSVDKVMENAKPILDEYIKKTYGVLPNVIG